MPSFYPELQSNLRNCSVPQEQIDAWAEDPRNAVHLKNPREATEEAPSPRALGLLAASIWAQKFCFSRQEGSPDYLGHLWNGTFWTPFLPSQRLFPDLYQALCETETANPWFEPGKRKPVSLMTRDLLWLSKFRRFKPRHVAATPDGSIDLLTGAVTTGKPTPNDGHRFGIPFSPRATPTPTWDEFLANVCPGEGEGLFIHHLFRMLITPPSLEHDATDSDKFCVFYGTPGSGKSTLLNVLSNLLGNDNVGALDHQELADERGPVSLYGRTLAICEEFGGRIEESGTLKCLVSNAPVRVRRLYREPERMRMGVRLIAACNTKPSFGHEAIEGMNRRLLILPMNYRPTSRDPYLHQKLLEESPGILHRILMDTYADATQALLTRLPASVQVATREDLIEQKPVVAFFLEQHPNGFGLVPVTEVIREFNIWADAHNIRQRPLPQHFMGALRSHFGRDVLTKSRPRNGLQRYSAWTYTPRDT